jgi:hypothetical protein
MICEQSCQNNAKTAICNHGRDCSNKIENNKQKISLAPSLLQEGSVIQNYYEWYQTGSNGSPIKVG